MKYSNLSIVFFTSMKNAVIVSEEGLQRHDFRVERLPGDGMYLSNLSHEEIGAIPVDDQDKRRLLAKSELLINPAYISKELGVDLARGKKEYNESALLAVLQGYKSALFRVKFKLDNSKSDIRGSLIRQVKERTMASDFREANCEGIDRRRLHVGAHSWVETGATVKNREFVRTVHLDRAKFYYYLLNQELPVDTWEAGDPALPVSIIMNSVSEGRRGFIAAGDHAENTSLKFISGCQTSKRREIYLPSEIVSLQEEDATFEMKDWWQGRVLKPRSPYDGCNPLSLADSLLMEMVYRSWRSQSLTGYWLAATERLIIHGIAEILSEDMTVIGYGSGKIAIATPKDSDGTDRQDNALLKLSEDCHIRLPIDHSWSANKLCEILPLLSDMQKIAVSHMESLADIDKSIDLHDVEGVGAAQETAKKSLEEKIA